MHDSKPRSEGDLRRFGLAFGGGLTVLGSLLLWRGKVPAPWVLAVAGLVLASALLAPRLLRPLEWLLARLFRLLTVTLTYVALTVVFFVVLTPIGLVRRLLGKDGLGLRPDPDRLTYWIDVPPDGPASRPDKPF
jgi:hypothetical protein